MVEFNKIYGDTPLYIYNQNSNSTTTPKYNCEYLYRKLDLPITFPSRKMMMMMNYNQCIFSGLEKRDAFHENIEIYSKDDIENVNK